MFNSEALEWQPAGAQKGAGEGLGVGSFQGCPPLNVGGCRELGQAAAAPTNPLGWAAEMLPVLLGTMQDVGQEWGDISQPGGPKLARKCHLLRDAAPTDLCVCTRCQLLPQRTAAATDNSQHRDSTSGTCPSCSPSLTAPKNTPWRNPSPAALSPQPGIDQQLLFPPPR